MIILCAIIVSLLITFNVIGLTKNSLESATNIPSLEAIFFASDEGFNIYNEENNESELSSNSNKLDKGEGMPSQGKVLSSHGKVLSSHGKVLSSHGKVLSSHGKVLSNQDNGISAKNQKQSLQNRDKEQSNHNKNQLKQKVEAGVLMVKSYYEKATDSETQEHLAQPKLSKQEENKVFDVVEQSPSFKGNSSQWLSDNVKYPAVAKKNGIQGRVIVGFVVGKDGSVRDIHVLRGADPSLDAEAVRVVSSMPRWNPGKQNGQAVNCRTTLPINFRLQ